MCWCVLAVAVVVEAMVQTFMALVAEVEVFNQPQCTYLRMQQ